MLFDSTPADDEPTGKETERDVVTEANQRWHEVKDWQGDTDERTRSDIKFSNGDSRNAWQWPDKIYQERTGGQSELPSLTINKTRVHNDIIINQMSKSGLGVMVRPTSGDASYEAAKVRMNLIRRINYQSNSTAQFRKVAEQQVDGGIGYIVLETRYVSNKSNDQDIYFRSARDPTGVYLDRWSTEPDGSDANYGFIFEEMSRREFNRKYPKWKNKVGSAPLNTEMMAWLTDKSITIVKYYRKRESPDLYVWWQEPGKEAQHWLRSELLEEIRGDESKTDIYKALQEQIKNGEIDGGTRKVTNDKVEWFLIAGDTVIDKGDWAGKYIPIAKAVGREVIIDKTLDRKGHTRPLIDAQRMLNYAASCTVEHVASAVKSQWLVPARGTEGQEQWKDANIKNYAVLTWQDIDDEHPDQPVPPPQRIDPPTPSPGWIKVGEDAERHMMMVSGQFQAQLGEDDQQSASSGKAINERQEQGDTATYHFIEHMKDMKRFIGVQLLDLIPKIYDTKRVLQIEDEMGKRAWVHVDPDQQEAVRELAKVQEEGEAARISFNPGVGEFEVISDPGPDFATKREETFNAMAQIMQANKELTALIADIFFKFSDFAGAEELKERFQKELKATKPYLFDEAQDPQLAALKQQNQQLIAINSELMTKLADEKLKVRGKDERRDIEAFKAQSDRMRAESEQTKAIVESLLEILPTPQQREQLDHEIAQNMQQQLHEQTMAAHDHIYTSIQQANEATISNESSSAE
jgi:hypothetical protein